MSVILRTRTFFCCLLYCEALGVGWVVVVVAVFN